MEWRGREVGRRWDVPWPPTASAPSLYLVPRTAPASAGHTARDMAACGVDHTDNRYL